MKLSVDSRGWMWAALLLLAAAYTAEAADNDTAPLVPVEKDNTSVATTTVPPTKGNETTSKVPEPPASPNATIPTTPISVTNRTTTTQAPVVTSASTTTTTTKAPVKTTSVNATTTISPVTSSISATLQKKSGFDVGSFVGGIVLTLGLLATVYFGCRFYSSKRGVRYRTIDEHEAII
ncbi:porimin [Ranitomeya imitator]|uniref:porimin n=1 Tax=Ranitomeya imitator TaxID=111125 RepID=UPI0037E9AA57